MTASSRRRFAGMPSPWLPLAIIGGLAAGVVLLYLLSWALSADIVAGLVPTVLPEAFGLVGGWLAGLTVFAAVLALFLHFYPLRARQLWLLRENKEVRRLGLRVARKWRELSVLCFPYVTDDEGEHQYVGLKAVSEKNGQLILIITLPAFAVSSGREQLVQNGGAELRYELGVHSVNVGVLRARQAELQLTVRDMTQETRKAKL